MFPEKPYRDSKGNKIIRLDADFVRDLEGGECRYISERTQQIALALLEYQHWKTRWHSAGVIDQDEIDAWVDNAAHELMDENPDCLSECYDFGPEVDAVAFTPQNPYTDPDFTPTGYAAPPFTVVKPTDIGLILLGLEVGDVITDLTRFPTGSLPTIIPPTGFARFRVTFTGNEIELHLLQIPGGGIVTVSYDDDPLTLATLDLSKDIFSLPVETVTVVTHQIEFATTAEHHVDVTFVPWVNDELPFLTYGGGIRSFTVCGTFGGTLMDVRQNEESPCTLEKTIDGEIWVPFANLRLCPPLMRFDPATGRYQYSTDGIGFYDFPDGPWTEPLYPPFHDPAPRGETGEENQRCAAAANAENVIHSVFNETSNYISPTDNTATDVAVGVASIIAVLLALPVFGWVVLVPIIGAMIAASVVLNKGDYTSGVAETLRCILYCNSTVSGGVVSFDFDAVKADVVAESGLPWPALAYILDIISAEGLDVAGGTTAITDAECACTDCVTCLQYIYTIGQYVVAPWSATNGTWSGIGPDYLLNAVSFGPYKRAAISGTISIPAGVTLTRVDVDTSTNGASGSADADQWLSVAGVNIWTHHGHLNPAWYGAPVSIAGPASVTITAGNFCPNSAGATIGQMRLTFDGDAGLTGYEGLVFC